ncbi:hypothetical protein [Kitasatospora cineracea]|uniref:Uncharacterized protein n=2 Tax=Kitasatospora cineracea TaxID=88074 RepID=A0A3N4RLU9_9ACTN|nr:hypothetical protein [Kitasatospora cineracea]RPE27930.1 hypothetical protein EDD38_7224 [Kitasatospora cineracea]
MSSDRRPLGLAFSEPAVDHTFPVGERPLPLPAECSPFLEPGGDAPAQPPAGRVRAQQV